MVKGLAHILDCEGSIPSVDVVKFLSTILYYFLKLHTLELSLKQINKILGQIDGYLFFWPFCSEKKLCEKPTRPYRLWKNADVCYLQHSAVPINLRIFGEEIS